MATIQVRMSDAEEKRLDKLVAKWQAFYDRQAPSARPIRVTRSSVLRDLVWEHGDESMPPVFRGFRSES